MLSNALVNIYLKVPKFPDTRKLCCNLPKIQTKRPKLRELYQNDANGIVNSEDTDQTAPLGATICPKTYGHYGSQPSAYILPCKC